MLCNFLSQFVFCTSYDYDRTVKCINQPLLTCHVNPANYHGNSDLLSVFSSGMWISNPHDSPFLQWQELISFFLQFIINVWTCS